jgi:hypothetical protein
MFRLTTNINIVANPISFFPGIGISTKSPSLQYLYA